MLPIVLGVGFALTFGAIGGFVGVKMGNWLENLLTEKEKEDLKQVFRQSMGYFDLSDPEDIKQLSKKQKQEMEERISEELKSKWGEKRFEEVESEIQEELRGKE